MISDVFFQCFPARFLRANLDRIIRITCSSMFYRISRRKSDFSFRKCVFFNWINRILNALHWWMVCGQIQKNWSICNMQQKSHLKAKAKIPFARKISVFITTPISFSLDCNILLLYFVLNTSFFVVWAGKTIVCAFVFARMNACWSSWCDDVYDSH